MSVMRIRTVNDAGATAREVRNSDLFKKWLARCIAQGFKIDSVKVFAAHKWGDPKQIKMLHIKAEARAKDGREVGGVVFLRGDCVDILTIISTESNEYALFVYQPRLAGAQKCVISNPSGMIDDTDKNVASAALRELEEETGAGLKWSHPISMVGDTVLPMLVTPGGSDERVYFYLVRANASEVQVAQMQGKLAGMADEGEQTRLYLVPLSSALTWIKDCGSPDLKTVTSLLLYSQMQTCTRMT